MKNYFYKWIEQYLFFPNTIQKLISVCLFPLTIIYCIVIALKRSGARAYDFGINIVSVGNLVLGGTGKTPLIIELAKKQKKPAIILRGYARASKGLYIIANNNKILHDIDISGDEAMLYAKSLNNATVIVCENRIEGILKAKELNCSIVFLDDGYRHHNIKKFDILLRPEIEPSNVFCLPSGGYKETKMMYSFVPLVLQDGVDFKRVVTFKMNNELIQSLPDDIVLLSSISKPQRLLKYLPKNIITLNFPDHHNYTNSEIQSIQNEYKDYTIITTSKDLVKLEKFNLKNIILMDLHINIIKQFEYNFE